MHAVFISGFAQDGANIYCQNPRGRGGMQILDMLKVVKDNSKGGGVGINPNTWRG